MTRKNDEKKKLEEHFADTGTTESSLSTLGFSPAMASGQSTLSAAITQGHGMQNLVAQAQNAHSISQAQTAAGVSSLLARKKRHKKKPHLQKFLERSRLFET